MEQEEKQESTSPLPVIPRLDRIDRLLQFLEEKHCSARKQNSSSSAIRQSLPEDQEFKTLSSALEEVHHKGTLMERVAMLENRVLQLTLQVDEGNTSGSSSSTIPDPVKTDKPSGLHTITRQEEGSAEACVTKPQASHKRRRQKTIGPITRHRKWLAWFQMGC
ncbi:hypothetical protein PVL29_012878 [Vitis rotundifolia]|uniref:Uncharacterized protein n=1 Tax=Vitis rotundifolia TaxID=103349 RepID=A0AA38ZK74_VITRO|nr:hypothetical protein PVL29_012878 [Vitis rotundifolia]